MSWYNGKDKCGFYRGWSHRCVLGVRCRLIQCLRLTASTSLRYRPLRRCTRSLSSSSAGSHSQFWFSRVRKICDGRILNVENAGKCLFDGCMSIEKEDLSFERFSVEPLVSIRNLIRRSQRWIV
eukprot:scaffold229660_cov59-Attheya_sp.AAC.3